LLAIGEVAWYWYLLVLAHWCTAVVVLTYFKSNLYERFKLPIIVQEVLMPYRVANFQQMLTIYISRLTHALSVAAITGVILSSLSINLELWQLLIFGPLMFASSTLPISAGGYGGPQGAAILLLVEAWELTTPETALAVSLVWSTLFLLSRLLLGLVGFVPYWVALQGKAELAAEAA